MAAAEDVTTIFYEEGRPMTRDQAKAFLEDATLVCSIRVWQKPDGSGWLESDSRVEGQKVPYSLDPCWTPEGRAPLTAETTS